MKYRIAIIATVLFVGTTSHAQAELVYKMTGVIPWNARIDPDFNLFGIGDSWTAIFTINEAVFDSESSSSIGVYSDAATHVKFSVSNGFTTEFSNDPASFAEVNVRNDYITASGPEDRVSVGVNSISSQEWLRCLVTTQDTSTLPSDDLPLYPTAFSQNAAHETLNFRYGRVAGDWEIDYYSTSNGTFEVVPEPSTIALFSTFGLVGGFIAWRRRSRA